MMSDLISRQDAIDVLDVLCQEHRYKIPGKAETYSQYNEAWQDALDRAEGAIGNLPSAEPEPHWIPCSEKLPKYYDYVLLTRKWGSLPTIGARAERDNRDFWLTNSGRSEEDFNEVIAWMPLPDPWKGGE